jgi:hypothetical protein
LLRTALLCSAHAGLLVGAGTSPDDVMQAVVSHPQLAVRLTSTEISAGGCACLPACLFLQIEQFLIYMLPQRESNETITCIQASLKKSRGLKTRV